MPLSAVGICSKPKTALILYIVVALHNIVCVHGS